ncbi:hypothetical protein F5Y14DRAFT_213264 [Nemania sp. NC0429]|nr:hypothetical protein F5Y14DRAFT_213264 [Nemania sp. NC0429]
MSYRGIKFSTVMTPPGRGMAIDTESVQATSPNDEKLEEKTKHYLTLRINKIPANYTRKRLKRELNTIAAFDSVLQKTIRTLSRISLVKINESSACGTATFHTSLPGEVLARRLQGASRDTGYHYEFDCEFNGITPLYEHRTAALVDVIAIPDPHCHPIECWKSLDNEDSWLQDYLPHDIPQLRVLLYGYDTNWRTRRSEVFSFQVMAERLLNRLITFRKDSNAVHRPIIFISHNTARYVVKLAVSHALVNSNEETRNFISACAGFLFFDTPLFDEDSGHWAFRVSHSAQFLHNANTIFRHFIKEENIAYFRVECGAFWATEDLEELEESRPKDPSESSRTYTQVKERLLKLAGDSERLIGENKLIQHGQSLALELLLFRNPEDLEELEKSRLIQHLSESDRTYTQVKERLLVLLGDFERLIGKIKLLKHGKVLPPVPNRQAMVCEISPDMVSGTSLDLIEPSLVENRGIPPSEPHLEVSLVVRPDVHMSILRVIYQRTVKFLSDVGLREPDILPGHQRIRWTNAYGKRLYDDYIELEPGALQALQDFLNTSTYYRSSPGSGYGSAILDFLSTLFPRRSTQPDSSGSGNIADQVRNNEVQIVKRNQAKEDIELGITSSATRHLFSAMEKGMYKVNLYQNSVVNVENDHDLFKQLQRRYHSHKGRLRSYLSLRTVHGIHFMKFVYGGPHYIDARCHYDICGRGVRCDCIPPEDRILPPISEYDCSLLSPGFSPPIGPQLLMDCFTNPSSINPKHKFVLEQLPKRIHGELGSQNHRTEAWGIYFKEGWDWAKIWWILAAGFFPPSLLFGILWGILKSDIQGAFGVASWWMTGAAIIVGIVGTYANR